MSQRRLRVLIVGGYGVFGGRLAQLLADEERLELIIAGRSEAAARTFCAGLAAAATMIPAWFDRDGYLAAQLAALAPDIVVDASGPFQAYGGEPYALVEAAIAQGADYLDLADGAAFVRGISRFDGAARARGRFVLAGASSFPVLTAAVVRRIGAGLARVETIEGAIAPSPYAGVGPNVIRAIASYAGRPVPLTRGGQPAVGYGLTETRRFTIAPPGHMPLRSTLFSLVDVPDLQLLPDVWPGLDAIWMGAGPVPASLHRGLIALAWLVRLRLMPSLTWLSPVFHRAINTLRWGEHRGGMIVAITGRGSDGSRVARSWHMVAEGGDGPLIPSMAVAALVRKCLDGQRPEPGARPATATLELADYEDLFARRTIFTGVRDEPADGVDRPLFARILGAAWERLPAPVRELHDFVSECTCEGRATVTRGAGLAARLVGRLFGFPAAGDDVPIRVRMTERDGVETWVRTFAGRSFVSRLEAGRGRSDRLVVESFGPCSFAMALVLDGGRLTFVPRRWSVLGVPMSLALCPSGDSYEHADGGRFNFSVEIRLPLIGPVVAYRGWLMPVGRAVAADRA